MGDVIPGYVSFTYKPKIWYDQSKSVVNGTWDIFNELGISSENLDWIMAHKEYTPFKNLNALTKRLQEYAPTVFISRADAFDPKNIAFEKFINNPIVRKVPLSEEQKKLYNPPPRCYHIKRNFFKRVLYADKI